MTKLTDEQTAEIERRCAPSRPPALAFQHSNPVELPKDQPARWRARVDIVMHVTGRDRTWCRARARELWPDEAEAAEKELAAA